MYFLFGMIMIGVGVVVCIYPEEMAILRYHRFAREYEPSTYAIWVTRIWGGLCALSGTALAVCEFFR